MQQQSARLETRAGEALMLRAPALKAACAARCSSEPRATLCQPFDRHVELVPTFPLPWAAVLLGVGVQIGGRRLCRCSGGAKQAERATRTQLPKRNTRHPAFGQISMTIRLNLGNPRTRETCVVHTLRQVLQFKQHGCAWPWCHRDRPRYGNR